jgi:integrase
MPGQDGIPACATRVRRVWSPAIGLDTDGDRVTVPRLLGHANVQTTAQYNRRGKRAKKKVVSNLMFPIDGGLYSRT